MQKYSWTRTRHDTKIFVSCRVVSSCPGHDAQTSDSHTSASGREYGSKRIGNQRCVGKRQKDHCRARMRRSFQESWKPLIKLCYKTKDKITSILFLLPVSKFREDRQASSKISRTLTHTNLRRSIEILRTIRKAQNKERELFSISSLRQRKTLLPPVISMCQKPQFCFHIRQTGYLSG